jgi:AcrR family transcriptional regulator
MAGRPRSFDTDAALDEIVEAFWDRGFAGTSVDDLQERIGVQRGSFYAAFGDKEAAWRRALDRYTGTVTATAIATLESPGPPADRVAAFIRFVGRFLAQNAGRGCMFLSAAGQPPPAGKAARDHLARLERELFAAIRRKAPEPVGSYVIAVLLGMNAMARSGMPSKTILAAAEASAEAAASMVRRVPSPEDTARR